MQKDLVLKSFLKSVESTLSVWSDILYDYATTASHRVIVLLSYFVGFVSWNLVTKLCLSNH